MNETEHQKKYRKKSSGFTLLEIVIAVGILAAMMLSVTQITSGILTKKQRNEIRMAQHHAVAIAFAKMSDDLHMTFLADTKFEGKDKDYKTGFVATENSMNFSTLSNVHFVKNKADSEQHLVGYYLEKNDEGLFALKRRQSDYLLSDLEEGGQSFTLLKDVSHFDLEFYDSNKKDWKTKWDTTSVSAAGRLPKIVKIKLGVMGEPLKEDEDKKEYNYEFLVEIPMYNTKISF